MNLGSIFDYNTFSHFYDNKNNPGNFYSGFKESRTRKLQ